MTRRITATLPFEKPWYENPEAEAIYRVWKGSRLSLDDASSALAAWAVLHPAPRPHQSESESPSPHRDRSPGTPKLRPVRLP